MSMRWQILEEYGCVQLPLLLPLIIMSLILQVLYLFAKVYIKIILNLSEYSSDKACE
jgi:hypothetical protein